MKNILGSQKKYPVLYNFIDDTNYERRNSINRMICLSMNFQLDRQFNYKCDKTTNMFFDGFILKFIDVEFNILFR